MPKQANLSFVIIFGLTTMLAVSPSKADIAGFFEDGLKSPRLVNAVVIDVSFIIAASELNHDGQTKKIINTDNDWNLLASYNSRNNFMNNFQYTEGSFFERSRSKFYGG
jgi:hypothetical protein